MASHLRDHGVRPEVVLCSPAVRTRQTLALILPALGPGPEVLVEDELYGAPAGDLLDRLRRLPDGLRSALVVGHNPGLQELAVQLARESARRRQVRQDFPTAALATLSLGPGGWAALDRGGAELTSYVVPRELG